MSDVLSVDDIAPIFSAPDQEGIIHKLSDYVGRWVLLYFYPKDNTPGCTKEACSLRDDYNKLQERGVVVLGVSRDSSKSHIGFSAKYNLPFTLLSDTDGTATSLFGTDGSSFPKRTTFLIKPDGTIAKIYDKVRAETHAADVLADLPALQNKE